MREILAFLWFVCLALLCAILILILVNAIRRTCFHSGHGGARGNNAHNNIREKYVDLYAPSLAMLPKTEILPGMTALVDMGMTNLETGIYMLQANAWIKIGVPELNDCYHIIRGDSAGKQHTIKASFVHEIRAPSETQLFDNEHVYQELQESTQTVYIHPDVRMACHLTTPTSATAVPKFSSALPHGRLLVVINASASIAFTFSIDKEQIVVAPQTIQHISLIVNSTDPLALYKLGAK
jgi:hypothetical protein